MMLRGLSLFFFLLLLLPTDLFCRQLYGHTPASSTSGNRHWVRMLEGLKSPQRQYFDTALSYLESMRSRPSCPESLREELEYQIALVHLEALQTGTVFLSHDEHQQQCRDALQRFLAEQPEHDLVYDAHLTLGRLSMDAAQAEVAAAEIAEITDQHRDQLLQQARAKYKIALVCFEAAEKKVTEQAKKLRASRKSNPDSVPDDVILTAYNRLLTGKVLVLLLQKDIAKTYSRDSGDYEDGLKNVAAGFRGLSQQYANYSVGIEAKLHAAKIYRDLGETESARQLLSELNTLHGGEYMKIRTESLLLVLEMNLREEKRPFYLDSINRLRAWDDSIPDTAKNSIEGQQVLLLGTQNLLAYAPAVRENKLEYAKMIREATDYLRQIGPEHPDLARQALTLLRSLGIETEVDVPKNFEQAKRVADQTWRDFCIVFSAFQQGANNTTPVDENTAEKSEVDLTDQGAPTDRMKVDRRLNNRADQCIAAIELAMGLREQETLIADINTLRQNLLKLFWFREKTLEAALIADYLARRDSVDTEAEHTALTAVRLYRTVVTQERMLGQDASAIATRLDKLADFILTRWPTSNRADEVRLFRIETAIDTGNTEQAQKLLADTLPGTPQRAAAELKIGLAFWNQYVFMVQQNTEGHEEELDAINAPALLRTTPVSVEELNGVLEAARNQLDLGLEATIELVKKGVLKLDDTVVRCTMILARIYVDQGRSERALRWLNDPTIGPLTLVENQPDTMEEGLLTVLRTSGVVLALRAYVAEENLDKAEEMMQWFERTASKYHLDEQELNRAYLALGREIEMRLEALDKTGQKDQADKLVRGFTLFLDRIKARGQSHSFSALYWVADTFYRLGYSISISPTGSLSAATEFYQQADEVYGLILTRLKNESGWGSDHAVDTIRLRRLELLRTIAASEADKEKREKLFSQAAEALQALLSQIENRIDFQVEAATLLECWGQDDPKKLIQAVTGGFPSKNIWGWNGLIRRTSNDLEHYAEMYYQAWAGKYRCVVELVRGETDPVKKERYFSTAKRDFTNLILMRPQLGGPESFERFDKIYRALQHAGNDTGPKGLAALTQARSEPNREPTGAALKRGSEKKEPAMFANKNGASEKTARKKKPDETLPLLLSLGVVFLFAPVTGYFMFRHLR